MGLKPVLVVFSGLPGTGKTTIARRVAETLGATYLRIDSAEQALLRSGELSDGLIKAGYEVCYALGADNLAIGHSVVADSVNPIPITREDWQAVAHGAGAIHLGVEIFCGDTAEHRRRVETRRADIAGHELPDWQAVVTRDYRPWAEADVRIDTCVVSAVDAAALIVSAANALQT